MPLAVDSDHAEARTLVEQIAHLCNALGAHWHPGLTIRIRDGQLCTIAPRGTTGPLVTLPKPLLIPMDGAVWSDDRERLTLLTAPDTLSPMQEALLHLQIALYNATDKMRSFAHDHPLRLAERSSAVAAALVSVKPLWPETRYRLCSTRNAATQFLESRLFRLPSRLDGGPRPQVLHPLIELINHHPDGAPYRVSEEAMRIDATQAAGDEECFARYGSRRDALDLAIIHGYLDRATPFAHIAPMTLEIDDLGRVVIEGQAYVPAQQRDAPRITLEGDGVTFSHLCCDATRPDWMVGQVSLALRGLLARRGIAEARARALAVHGLQAIGAANVARLEALSSACAIDAGNHPGGRVLDQAARHQAEIIRRVLMQGAGG